MDPRFFRKYANLISEAEDNATPEKAQRQNLIQQCAKNQHECVELLMQNPSQLKTWSKDEIERLEIALSKDLDAAIDYIKYVKKSISFNIENEIYNKNDSDAAYRYCMTVKSVLGSRFPGCTAQIQEVIAKDPKTAYLYAKNIVKGRWPEGEPSIKRSEEYKKLYASEILRHPFIVQKGLDLLGYKEE